MLLVGRIGVRWVKKTDWVCGAGGVRREFCVKLVNDHASVIRSEYGLGVR